MAKHGNRQLGAAVAPGGGLAERLHRAAQAGEAQQAAGVVEDLVEGGGAQALAQQVQQQARIEGAAAASHHQALQGREAHGGVEAEAIADGAEGAARPQVATDQSQGPLAREALGHHLADVLVVEAMEAKAAQALLPPGGGDRVGGGRGGQAAVEGGVETGRLGPGRLPLGKPADRRQGRGVVQRRQGHQFGNRPDLGGAQSAGGHKTLAAMDNPMGHQADGSTPGHQGGPEPLG